MGGTEKRSILLTKLLKWLPNKSKDLDLTPLPANADFGRHAKVHLQPSFSPTYTLQATRE